MIVINQQKKVSQKILHTLQQTLVLLEKKTKKKLMTITFCDDRYIKKYNKQYRHQNKATDVLSFPMHDTEILGDIIISLPYAQKNAKQFNNSLETELAYLLIHGYCHLCGHDHASPRETKIMQRAENTLIKTAKLNIQGRINHA